MKWQGMVLGLILCLGLVSAATPRQIVIVRHGEKTNDTLNNLSPQGCERANLLPEFFRAYASDVVAIYAQQPEKAGDSIRPLETIAPTAQGVHLKINNNFLRDNVSGVSADIMNNLSYNGKTIFMAWEHTAILDLAKALGISLPSNIQKWPDGIFDQAWVLTYPAGGGEPTLTIVAEHVLPTDILPDQSGIVNWGKETAPTDNGLQIPTSIVQSCQAGDASLDLLVKSDAVVPVPGL